MLFLYSIGPCNYPTDANWKTIKHPTIQIEVQRIYGGELYVMPEQSMSRVIVGKTHYQF